MKCYICEEEITDYNYFLTALDLPYINLYRHKTCKEPSGEELVEKIKLYIKNQQFPTKKRKI